MADNDPPVPPVPPVPPLPRCALILDKDLPLGYLANAVAVLALSVGGRHPALIGEAFTDAGGTKHAGLIQTGLPVLSATADVLSHLRRAATETGCDVIDFPERGQRTTDYRSFCDAVGSCPPEEIRYLGVALVGEKRAVNKLIGNLGLLR